MTPKLTPLHIAIVVPPRDSRSTLPPRIGST
jgi:hypothetical protein